MALKSPRSYVKCVFRGVNTAKEGHENFSEVSIEARQGRVEGMGVLVLGKLPAGSLPSCWQGTEESLCV